MITKIMRDPDNEQDTREYLYFWRDQGYKDSGSEEVRIYTPNKTRLKQIENTSSKWQYYTLLKGLKVKSAPWMKDLTIEHRDGISAWEPGVPDRAEGNTEYEKRNAIQNAIPNSPKSKGEKPVWIGLIPEKAKDLKRKVDKEDALHADDGDSPAFKFPYPDEFFDLVASAKVLYYSKHPKTERDITGCVWKNGVKGAMWGWKRKIGKEIAAAELNHDDFELNKLYKKLRVWQGKINTLAVEPAKNALRRLNAPYWMITDEDPKEDDYNDPYLEDQAIETENNKAFDNMPLETQVAMMRAMGLTWDDIRKRRAAYNDKSDAGENAMKDRNTTYIKPEDRKAKDSDYKSTFADILNSNKEDPEKRTAVIKRKRRD
jgi:hypothetical protein